MSIISKKEKLFYPYFSPLTKNYINKSSDKIKKFYGYQDVSARVTKGVEPINFIFDEIIKYLELKNEIYQVY